MYIQLLIHNFKLSILYAQQCIILVDDIELEEEYLVRAHVLSTCELRWDILEDERMMQ